MQTKIKINLGFESGGYGNIGENGMNDGQMNICKIYYYIGTKCQQFLLHMWMRC